MGTLREAAISNDNGNLRDVVPTDGENIDEPGRLPPSQVWGGHPPGNHRSPAKRRSGDRFRTYAEFREYGSRSRCVKQQRASACGEQYVAGTSRALPTHDLKRGNRQAGEVAHLCR
eukprot:15879009-Heterocapsa_arctica.AAC.1